MISEKADADSGLSYMFLTIRLETWLYNCPIFQFIQEEFWSLFDTMLTLAWCRIIGAIIR